MIEQLDLISDKAPKISAEEVNLLIACLRGKGWLTARLISQALSWPDRKIRAVANASEGQVISGQLGYRLTCEASIAEIQHATKWMRHQANAMLARVMEIDRVYHGKARGV